MIQPRAYQQDLVNGIRDAIRKGFRRVACYAPTGSGKSILAALIAVGAAQKGTRCLILTHREEICFQDIKKAEVIGLRPAIVHAKTKSIPDANLCVAMSQTVAARIQKHKTWTDWLSSFQIVIVDECHRLDHQRNIEALHPKAAIVGLSATLLRSGAVPQLGETYEAIVVGVKPKELIELGFLVPTKNYTFTAPKLDDISVSRGTGDYHQAQLQKRFSDRILYKGVVSEWLRLAPNTKTIVFGVGGEQVIQLTQEFMANGVKAKYLLSGKYPDTDKELSGKRRQVLDEFESGVFDVLVSCQMVTTGYDFSALQTVILATATQSYTLYQQMIGRVVRPHPSKEFGIVLDFGNCLATHGIAEAEPVMSLWHSISTPGPAPVKDCECGRLIPVSARICPFCGKEFLNERENYEAQLSLYIEQEKEEQMTLEQWVAKKILIDGWSNNRVLMSVCIRNLKREKAAFMETIKILRTKHGKTISDKYWYFFSKEILSRAKKKKVAPETTKKGEYDILGMTTNNTAI